MQSQRADAQSFFGVLATLEHVLAAWVRARHGRPGTLLRAIGFAGLPSAPAPLRLAGPAAPGRPDAQSDVQAAEAEARRQAHAREIAASQKAVIEQLRDRNWYW